MIDNTAGNDRIRRKIEALGTQLSLPTVRKALGILEGEHPSNRRFGNDDLINIRNYEVGDEARQIDWKISARSARPMIVERERLSSGRVYLLVDVSRPMSAMCPSYERAYSIAANALCMFAALSLRRSDEISLILADAEQIVRKPFHGGLAHFEGILDQSLDRDYVNERNIDALLDYAGKLRDRNALVVLATDEHALNENHFEKLNRITRSHPFVLIDIACINPFEQHPVPNDPSVVAVNGMDMRAVPAFMRSAKAAKEVRTHRAYMKTALEQELAKSRSRMIYGESSEAMFREFIRLLSLSRSGTPGYRKAGQAGKERM